ncbi:ABC transporter ATP-binding protein [Roseomonas sp. AR75]|uniref:ABC transporter ATP-binding protein n=1 Tax=Roseomonas sp. AR75 TaxID=2562311 RepID=UPI0010C13CE2|nr:ABC transporter ATP-binding protein [Roseomonas sp. AR75]
MSATAFSATLDAPRGAGGIALSVRGVSHVFRSKGRRVLALQETDLEVREQEFLTIVGPSGCGKSTLMNLIVGLFPPTSGQILLRGTPISGINRSIGYVTQADNLYPWRTLRQNVEFPLEIRGVPARQRRERAEALIQRVGLGGFGDAWPYELSGGMRQRANIIRTLAYDPDVILMDEPFGPLDAQTRLILQNQLLELWQSERKTVIFITHDLGEAVALADRVVVMSARPGRIKAVEEIPIPRPRNLFEIHADDRFRDAYKVLWASLEEEVRKGSEV